ncbi:MAG: hypothetical protein JRD68_06165 [Deltaproteobacteria bacterium]|nr:hypothetical protein [Deltaproteobacteria bacterium]
MMEQENLSLNCNAKHNVYGGAQDNVKAIDSWLIYLSRDIDKTFRWSKNEIDLVLDSINSAFGTTKNITKKMVMHSKRGHHTNSNEEALLQDLGFAVSEYPDGDHLSLQYDMEFQQLVKQLRSLTGKVVRKAVAGEEPRREKTPDVSHEGPGEISQEVPDEIPKQEDAPKGAMAEKPKIAVPAGKTQEKTNRHPLAARPVWVVGSDNETIPQEDDVPMAETRKPAKRRYLPAALADRANNKFLSIGRSVGKAVYFVQSCTMDGLSKIGHALSEVKKEEKE